MAATEAASQQVFASLLAAAAALPLTTIPVHAGQIEELQAGVNYLTYREQDGRMSVNAPQAWIRGAVATNIDLETRVTIDAVSGASPQAVSNQSGRPVHALSSASIREVRREGMLRATHWRGDDSFAVGASVSSERDYLSQTVEFGGKFEFLNRNVTLALGMSASRDDIGATGIAGIQEHRSTRSLFAGLTQLLSPTDIIQSNLAYGAGRGYYNDPYRSTITFLTPASRIPLIHADLRPDSRQTLAWLTRWRHYLPSQTAALAVDYRYYRDSWDIRAHTVEASWHQNFGTRWAVRPSLRWYGQSAASFYSPTFATRAGLGSSDARLAAFGAATLAVTLIATTTDNGTFELGAGRYAQRANWRPGGGSPDLPAFDANFITAGWTWRF